MQRQQTKAVKIGDVQIGGQAPIVVQSMTNTDTRNVAQTVTQIQKLAVAGCELIRVAVPDTKAAAQLSQIKTRIQLPLVADIHFDYQLALQALEQGVDGLRLNPGNIGDKKEVKQIADKAANKEVPIRVGVNAGSLAEDLIEKYGQPTAEAMVESPLGQINLLERFGFEEIIISLKASDVNDSQSL